MDIKKRDRNQLKSYFVKRAVPSEQDFAELIDGMLNQKDDRVVKQPGGPLSLEAVGDAASRRQVLELYETFDDSNPAWSLSMNPRAVVSDPSTARPGFSIDDRSGLSRLFIDDESGHVGIGTVEPQARLDIAGDTRVAGELSVDGELRVDSAVHVAPGSIALEPWIDLPLEPAGKWKPHGGDHNGFSYSSPRCFKDSQGIVYLQGLIRDGVVRNATVILTLPEGYRPENAVLLHVYSHGPSAGSIAILPTGDMLCWTNIATTIILDGLLFRAAQ